MKKLKFLGAVAMATVLLTSCLDGGKNEQSGAAFGVIGFSMDAMGNVAYTGDDVQVYASSFNELQDNECVYFAFNINYDDPANSGKKYLTATVSQYVRLDNTGRVEPVDTAKTSPTSIKKGEITAVDAGIVATGAYSATIKDYLFLGSSHEKSANDQTNSYYLQIDPSQEPQVVDGKNVYDFFLRVVKVSDGKNTIGTSSFNYAIRAGGYISSLESKEKAKGSDTFNYRINYIKEFNKDTTEATWAKSKVLSYMINKESK
ncbi:MAG: hypothetical protein ACK5N4_22040 [Parabacteroides gordonii]|uniref:hypothetical protein n=1 Tax=Parabacteroides gordonii TaxID=574930 RepID=UPI003A837D20